MAIVYWFLDISFQKIQGTKKLVLCLGIAAVFGIFASYFVLQLKKMIVCVGGIFAGFILGLYVYSILLYKISSSDTNIYLWMTVILFSVIGAAVTFFCEKYFLYKKDMLKLFVPHFLEVI